jgi:NADH-quinone oxidoreductase subunit A
VSGGPLTQAVAGGYASVAILILLVVAMGAVIIGASRLIGPRRVGPIKHGTYESGVDPIGDSRGRFHIRFYIVAMLFLLFDVEVVFLWPWAPLFVDSARDADARSELVSQMVAAGYDKAFLLGEMGIFVLILLVGYMYAWGRGVFRWT